jgi:hypothetical protein
MATPQQTLIDLEKRFWQSMVDHDTDTALGLLNERALMVSSHGAMQFDHAGYRKMAEHGSMVLTAYELHDVQVTMPTDDTAILTYRVTQQVAPREGGGQAGAPQEMNDSSTWVRSGPGGEWRCVMHTETPVAAPAGKTH